MKTHLRLAADDAMLPMATAIKAELKALGVRTKVVRVENVLFPAGEVKPRICGNVRNSSVFHLGRFSSNPNDDLVRYFLTLQALHLADAKRITSVALYLPYMRQDRKDEPRVPISAKWVIDGINASKRVKRLVTVDIHSEQLLSNFDIPTDHLPGRVIFAPWARERFAGKLNQLVVVAPDEGSYKRALKLAASIGPEVQVAMFNKDRKQDGVKLLNIIGADVRGKICLINDDMMDTCGTIINAVKALRGMGAAEVVLSATHAVFSPTIIKHDNGQEEISTAYEKLAAANVEVVVTDSMLREAHDWLTVLPWAKHIAHVIYQNVTDKGSVSKLIREGLPSLQ